MPDLPFTVLLMIALALVFDFLNGFHDSSNIVATIIASRALSGHQALAITALAEFTGPFLFGVAVATTLGHDVLADGEIKISVVLAGLVEGGVDVIQWGGLAKVIAALLTSPVIGLIVGYALMKLVLYLARGATPG